MHACMHVYCVERLEVRKVGQEGSHWRETVKALYVPWPDKDCWPYSLLKNVQHAQDICLSLLVLSKIVPCNGGYWTLLRGNIIKYNFQYIRICQYSTEFVSLENILHISKVDPGNTNLAYFGLFKFKAMVCNRLDHPNRVCLLVCLPTLLFVCSLICLFSGTYGNRQVLSVETNGPFTHVFDF